jgi:hypothetical protein
MSLAERLNMTATKLIGTYGNVLDIIIETNSGDYDPSTGGYATDSTTIYAKGSVTHATNKELSISNIEEMLWSKISSKILIPYNDELEDLDNKCSVNGMKVYSIEKVVIQDKIVVVKLLVG